MFPPLRLRQALTLGGLTPRETVVRTWRMMNEHEIFTRASAVAFYGMLAAVPFLGLVLLLAVQLLPDLTGFTHVRGVGDMTVDQLERAIDALFPRDVTALIKEQIANIQKAPPVGLLSLGLLITLWSASTLYTVIIDAMNRIDGVKETRSYLRLRLVAVVMTVIEATILVGSLVVIVAWSVILRWLGLESTPAAILATAILWIVLTAMVLSSFAVTFYVAPDAKTRWEWITPGSFLGALAFLVTSLGFRYYIQHLAHYDKTYGSLGGVMVLMFWFWLTSVVLLVAAQMNKVIEDASPLGKRYGQRVDPTVPPDLDHVEPVPASSTSGSPSP